MIYTCQNKHVTRKPKIKIINKRAYYVCPICEQKFKAVKKGGKHAQQSDYYRKAWQRA